MFLDASRPTGVLPVIFKVNVEQSVDDSEVPLLSFSHSTQTACCGTSDIKYDTGKTPEAVLLYSL